MPDGGYQMAAKQSSIIRSSNGPPSVRRLRSQTALTHAIQLNRSENEGVSITQEVESASPMGALGKRRSSAHGSEYSTNLHELKLPRTPRRSHVRSARSSESNGASCSSTDRASKHRPRSVAPQKTNAPLVTPGGSRVVALACSEASLQGQQDDGDTSTSSTANILDKAYAHLIEMDPTLRPLIETYPCKAFSPEGLAEQCEPFRVLASSICAQQVSVAAASSIKKKFIGLFRSPNDQRPESYFPSPHEVTCCDVSYLRQAGLSQRKAEYIKGLAEKFEDGSLSADLLLQANDEEVIERLTAVRGLGRWSAEMFACFGLKRTDIFSTGDLGIQRGMAAFAGKDVNKLRTAKAGGGKWKYMSEKEMIETAQKFSPYRSVYMTIVWRSLELDADALKRK